MPRPAARRWVHALDRDLEQEINRVQRNALSESTHLASQRSTLCLSVKSRSMSESDREISGQGTMLIGTPPLVWLLAP